MDMLSESLTGNRKALTAASRLSGVFSIRNQLHGLDADTTRLYIKMLNSFVHQGHSMAAADIVKHSKSPVTSIRQLHQQDIVSFDNNSKTLEACPFTTNETPYNLFVNGHHLYATCALDALAVASIFSQFVKINAVCHITDALIYILQLGREIMNQDDVKDVYFGINWSNSNMAINCKNNMRSEMIFLKGDDTATYWKTMDYENREIFNLQDAVCFAAEFFMPMQTLFEPIEQLHPVIPPTP